jgi:hypothetical protein
LSVPDPLAIIEDGCRAFICMGKQVSTTLTRSLCITDGCFLLPGDIYHPLEAALVGQDVVTGHWERDLAALLGVNAAWLQGFIHGFARSHEESGDQEYLQGYLAAEDLRNRYERWFPALSQGGGQAGREKQ